MYSFHQIQEDQAIIFQHIEGPISKPTLKCPVKVKVNADEVEDTLNKTTAATTCTTFASKNEFFQRLWSVDDEIVILQGIMDYTTTKGVDPSTYMNVFFLFIKDSIHVNDTKTQLSDKVRKLKNKYKTNAIKAKLPSNPHD
ncbi:hypothetical protein HYC85_000084 [Camellia sinensis]|uniref:Glabrous enhancer-binding protein-like DBD domain-containing protein n=1 Tax=Camellia sinensis TaxID=4442 RepID=A0A7J7FPA7_CAMSI|nr:hypothetical protein HYC85_000084 [Camellia sinensis]